MRTRSPSPPSLVSCTFHVKGLKRAQPCRPPCAVIVTFVENGTIWSPGRFAGTSVSAFGVPGKAPAFDRSSGWKWAGTRSSEARGWGCLPFPEGRGRTARFRGEQLQPPPQRVAFHQQGKHLFSSFPDGSFHLCKHVCSRCTGGTLGELECRSGRESVGDGHAAGLGQ